MDQPERRQRMQRVRIGLTGLAIVFLLVITAAAVLGLAGREDLAQRSGLSNGAVPASDAGTDEAPKEPLAELGVAPGNAPPEALANGAAAPQDQ